MAACALVHLCYQWGLPLLPAPNLFHEYIIEACGKELANEIGFLLSPIPTYFKLSCYLPLTFKFGNMLHDYCCCYDGHFHPGRSEIVRGPISSQRNLSLLDIQFLGWRVTSVL